MAKKAAKGKPSGKGRGNSDSEMTAPQLAFVEYYCITLNATEALRRVRAKFDVTRQAASQMKRNPKVSDAISRRLRERGEHNDQLCREVIETQAAIMRARLSDVVDLETKEIRDKIPERALIALSELTVKTYEGGSSVRVKLSDKGAAADRLSKLLGMHEQVDPMDQKREQVRQANVVIKERLADLKARLAKTHGDLQQELSLAELAAMADVQVVE